MRKKKRTQEKGEDTGDRSVMSQGGRPPPNTDDSSQSTLHSKHTRPHWADSAVPVVTCFMLVTYIAGNYLSCRQLKLAATMANTSIEEVHRSHRPWVALNG